MKNRLYAGLRLALVGLFAVGAAACDDPAPIKTPDMQGMGGEGGGAGGMGGAGGGGMGGMGGMGGGVETACADDADCAASQYCRKDNPDAIEGRCLFGCRDNNCPAGEICNLTTRECQLPGCSGDDARCAAGQFCDPATDQCRDGCRTEPDSCPEGDDGRAQLCVEAADGSRSCTTVFACCNADACTAATEAACTAGGGTVLQGALSCDGNPCASTRCEGDSDCAEGEYCGPDGLCIPGCQVGELCPNPDLACDPLTRACVEVPCDGNDQCAEAFQFCDTQLNICRFGCRGDADCEDGLTCVQGVCLSVCDPGVADACGPGAYCDANLRQCRDDCDANDDCNEDEACNFGNNQCERGRCRDDGFEPNNDVAEATVFPVGQANAQGIRQGLLEDLILCNDDVAPGATVSEDYYAVDLAQGERIQVELFNPGVGDANIDLELIGDEVNGELISATLEETEILQFPEANRVLPATRYYIRVFGDIDESTRYSLRVTIVPAENACFPDGREPDNNQAQATRIPGDQARYVGTICAADEDWFTLPLGIDDGVTLTVTTPANSGELRLRLYSNNRLSAPGGLASPEFEAGPPQIVAGRRRYEIVVRENENNLADDNFFLRITARNQAEIADYDLNVVVVRVNDPCLPDPYEPNDRVAEAVVLDNLPGISQAGQVIANVDHPVVDDAGICIGDRDYYCLTAEGGDILEAWIVGEQALVVGELQVQWVDGQDGAVGGQARLTEPGAAVNRARAPGVVPGRYCARVTGLGRAEGPYSLFVRRSVLDNPELCPQDAAETAPGARRNDRADDAVALQDVSGGAGLRFQYDQGVLCDVNMVRDQDWYTFEVPRAESRVCVTTEGFSNAQANVDLQVYQISEAGNACQNDAACGAAGACIQGQCRAFSGLSTTSFDAEMINLTPSEVGNRTGRHYARVFRGAAGAITSYIVTATVTPPGPCQPDWQEIDARNNDPGNGTNLGSGEIALCDTWICRDEAVQGDWYDILVPAGEDRTVFIEYQQAVDGGLSLFYSGPANTIGAAGGFGALNTVGNYLCMNVKGGADDQLVTFGITGQPNPGRDRVDYNVRVVPTDVAAQQAVGEPGECYTLGAIGLPTCEPDANGFYMGCFPTFTVP